MCYLMVKKRKTLVNVVVVGDVSVGKTSLLHRYVYGRSATRQWSQATVGTDLLMKEVEIVDGTKITVQIWDTAGQARCVGPTAAYYRRADCCVLVFDVTEPTTFDSLAGWRNSFLVDSNVRDHLSFPFVVVGNKVDQLNGRNDQMDFRKVIRWCQANNGIPYFHTSAKDGSRVDDAFQKIVQYAYDFNKKFSDVNRSSFMLVPTTTEQMDARISKEGCC